MLHSRAKEKPKSSGPQATGVSETNLLQRRRRLDIIISLLGVPIAVVVGSVFIPPFGALVIPIIGPPLGLGSDDLAQKFLLSIGYEDSPLTYVSWWLGVLILALFAILLQFRSNISSQLAHLVLRAEVPEGPFILYLRSFFVDEALNARSSGLLKSMTPDNLQDRISKGVGSGIAIAKIGSRTLFDFAGGTIKTDDDSWFSDFQKLADGAWLIVMTPIVLNPRSGTSRELREIAKRNWQHKTVFIVPQNWGLWIPWGQFRIRTRVRDMWARSQLITQRLAGIALPRYRGTALILFDGGQWLAVTGVAGRVWEHPKALAYLLDPTTPAPKIGYCATRVANRLVLLHLLLLPLFMGFLFQLLASGVGLEAEGAPSFFFGCIAAVLVLAYPYFNYCRRFTITDLDALKLYSLTLACALPCLFFVQTSLHAEALLAPLLKALGDTSNILQAAILLAIVWGIVWALTFALAYLILKTIRPTPRWKPGNPLSAIPLVRGPDLPMVAQVETVTS